MVVLFEDSLGSTRDGVLLVEVTRLEIGIPSNLEWFGGILWVHQFCPKAIWRIGNCWTLNNFSTSIPLGVNNELRVYGQI